MLGSCCTNYLFLEFAKKFSHEINKILMIIEHVALTWLQIIGNRTRVIVKFNIVT